MPAYMPPAPPQLKGPLKRAMATITLEVEAASLQEAHNALVAFTEYGRLFEHLEAHGARCVKWNGVRVWEPRVAGTLAKGEREVE